MGSEVTNPGAVARTPVLAVILGSSALWLAPTASLAADRAFDIAPRPMGEALNEFARQAGVQIFFPGDAIAGRRARAVRGVMAPRAALDRLIAGTGLAVAEDDGRMVILRVARGGRRVVTPRATMSARVGTGPETDAATALEAVIVTSGPRAGDLKRDSDTVVNTITQLEIQRLPNLDLSDVLARLPGVRRNETQSGENRYVQIRGLNNAAASQSIDGVLLTSYVNGSHATSTELIPAYFTKSVTVTTTVTPDLDENANSAHVALTTISGLDGEGERVADLRGLVGGNNRSDGLRRTRRPVRLVGSWKGALDGEGRLGLAIGAGLDHLGSRQDAVSATSFDRTGGAPVPNGALTRGETYTRTERISAMARLDARPTERLALFAEYFFLKHDFSTEQRTATVSVASADASDVMAGSGRFGVGAVGYGFNRSHLRLTDHIVQLGGDHALGARDALSVRLGVTLNRVSSSPLSTSGFALASSALATPIGYAVDHHGLAFTPGGSALTRDPANYRLVGKVTVGDILSRDQNYFARIDYSHNVAPDDQGLGVKLGGQLKTQDRSNLQRGYARLPTAGAISLADVTTTAALTLFQPVDWDVAAMLGRLRQWSAPSPDTNGLYAQDPADGYGQNFNGSERIAVGYAIASYGGSRTRLSAGVRAAHTRRELDQYEPDAAGRYVQGRYRQTYWHVLPSLYGFHDLTPSLKLRGAFTKTLERPAINSAGRRLITSYDTPVTRSISYSNPYLLPIRSSNFDVSAEYYPGGGAYLSLGAFAKELRDIAAVSSSLSVAPDGSREITTYASNVREVDGKKVYGRVRGLEAVWSDPRLPGLPDRFGNLGLTLSYVYLDYRFTALNGGGGVAPSDTRLIPAAPRHFRNATLAYNRGRLAANLSVQDMSSAPAFTYDPANDRRTRYEPLVDMQASWQVSDKLRILVEGRNLLDQDTTDRALATNYGPAYQIKNNGRTIWFGLQMTLF